MRINNIEINFYNTQKPKIQTKPAEKQVKPDIKHSNNTPETVEIPDKIPEGSHLIKEGETLYSIANKYNTTVAELIALNPDLQTDKNGNKIIRLGAALKIPDIVSKKSDAPDEIHGIWEIEAGKGAYSVMTKFNLFREELEMLNPDIDLDNIQKGTLFNVPGYKVKEGDSFYSIAKKHGITVKMLKELNPDLGEVLNVDSIINVPKPAGGNLTVEEKIDKHTIQQGENLYRIAQNYGVPLWALMLQNNIEDETKIFPDQVLQIPTKEQIEALEQLKSEDKKENSVEYIVKKGDVLSQIALDNGVSSAALIFKNNIQDPTKIMPGDKIIIPDKAEIAQLEAEYKKSVKAVNVSSQKQIQPQDVISQNRGIVIHKIKKGDTIESIAQKYGIAAKDLSVYNPELKNIKFADELFEKNIKKINIVATKKAVIEATGVSEEFIDDLISLEQKRSRLYNDACSIPTIGIGHNTRAHNDTKYYRGRTLSDNEIYSLLARDIVLAQNSLKAALKESYENLTMEQKEALYGLSFNTGNFTNSPKLIQALKEGDYREAACQFDHIAGTQNGVQVVLPGLVKRRLMDISKFISGSDLSKKDIAYIMDKVQQMYDKGFENITNDNTKVDYNAFAKKFMGEFIDRNLFELKS